MNIQRHSLLYIAGVLGAALFMAACSSSGKTAASSSSNPAAGSSSATTGSSSSNPSSGVTINTASVSGYGTVLVNSSGGSLYILSSEKGGKVTCVATNGCTAAWPPVELPQGVSAATAGPGVQASKLGTAKAPDGSVYVTYGGYPLYTFAADSASGQTKGENITNFGGTWYLMAPSGTPVTSSVSSTTTAKTSGGYGY